MGVEIQYPRTTLEVDRLWRQNQYHSRVRNYDLAMAFIGDSRGYLATRSFESPEHQIWDPIMDIITHVDPDIEGSIGFIPSYLLMLDHPGSKP
jgi:hypothetical protein